MLMKGDLERPSKFFRTSGWYVAVPGLFEFRDSILLLSSVLTAQAKVEAQATFHHQLMWPTHAGLCIRKVWMVVGSLAILEDCHDF